MKTIGTLSLNVQLSVRETDEGEAEIAWYVQRERGPGAAGGTTDLADSAVNGVREVIETLLINFIEELDS